MLRAMKRFYERDILHVDITVHVTKNFFFQKEFDLTGYTKKQDVIDYIDRLFRNNDEYLPYDNHTAYITIENTTRDFYIDYTRNEPKF